MTWLTGHAVAAIVTAVAWCGAELAVGQASALEMLRPWTFGNNITAATYGRGRYESVICSASGDCSVHSVPFSLTHTAVLLLVVPVLLAVLAGLLLRNRDLS